MTLLQSPLADRHRALGANMVEFGGWEMPIAYPTGTIEEHLACRQRAAAFDVSHLGTVRVEGEASFDNVAIVYYPGVRFFADMLRSEFYQGIFGDKQLGDTQIVITVPILDRL